MSSPYFFIFLFLFVLSSCKNEHRSYQKIQGIAQGTTYVISFEPTKKQVRKASIDSIFAVIDRSLSLWENTSLISKFNQSTTSDIVADAHFRNVLQKSFEIYQQSGGAFDPTVGPLVKSWGFIRKKDLPLPSHHSIDSLLQFVGLNKVELRGFRVSKKKPSVELDFNAIAQGYTVDVLADYLEKHQITNYLVEVGGELKTKGKNSDNENWKVGVEKPLKNDTKNPNDLQLILAVDQVSLATSGNYRNFTLANGLEISHILNPKTGKPVAHHVVSVSVIAPTCTQADAWATAFSVLGKEKSIELSRKIGLDIQIISYKHGAFEVYQSEGFKKRVQK